MKTDIEIAQSVEMERIAHIGNKLGIDESQLIPYGHYKAKLALSLMKPQKGKLVLVTAINPTKAGEGKSTTTIGLADSLREIGIQSIVALREPSLGPVFGMKGGAAGGGYAQVVPMEDLNLHFTGDMHAITTAHNLVSATIDNHLHFGNELMFEKVTWKRVLDMNDRSLRQVVVGIGKSNGPERNDGFMITVASEIMAILCLSSDFVNLKERISKVVVGYNSAKTPITIEQLGIVGAIALVLKDALLPNLVQTLEGTPVIVHGGPFANIAHGCNSVIATKMALGLGEVVVTEAGFGADLGAEKFMNIKCRMHDLNPDAVVVVATVRALKLHGGQLYDELKHENIEALKKGVDNLDHHLKNMKQFNVPAVVCINRFSTDTDLEVEWLVHYLESKHVEVSVSTVFKDGGKGGIDLAHKVMNAMKGSSHIQFTYETNDAFDVKISEVATSIYGARNVTYSEEALEMLKWIEITQPKDLLVCIAKTQYSFSDNPLTRDGDVFDVHVESVDLSAGAGFIVVKMGKIMTMPGLPRKPAALSMSIDENGKIEGLF